MARKDGKDRGLFERPTGSGIWWIFYVDERGDRHREKVGPNKTKARKRYLQRKAEVAEGRHKPPTAKRELLPTLEDAITDYLTTTGSGKRSWRDDRNYGTLWSQALGKLPLDAIKPQDVERFKVDWGRQLAPATVNRRLSFLRRIFNVAIRNGHEVKNPVPAVGMFRENNSRNAARSIAAVMPTIGLCRAIYDRHRAHWPYPSIFAEAALHKNQRFSRKTNSGSEGWNLLGRTPESLACERARSLSPISACRYILVVSIDSCPSHRAITVVSTPRWSICIAAECLRVCGVTRLPFNDGQFRSAEAT